MNLGPIAYVQQVIVKAMVHPYKKDEMIKTDAFRGPLASAFKLHLQDLALFRDLSTNQDMDKFEKMLLEKCLEGDLKTKQHLLTVRVVT